MNREERILDYLNNKEKYFRSSYERHLYQARGITVKEAEQVLGTTELRKAMSNLRQKGYKVTDVWEYGEDRFGNEIRYKRYFVEGKVKKEEVEMPGFEGTMEYLEKLTKGVLK